MPTEQFLNNQYTPQFDMQAEAESQPITMPFDVSQNAQNTTKGKRHLSKLKSLKVKTPEDVQKLMNEYGQAMQFLYPSGFDLYNEWRPIQDGIIIFNQPPTPHDKRIVTLFQKMKLFAQVKQLNDLADAVTSSAYWYWKNVENKGQSTPSTSVATYGIGQDDLEKAKKIEKRAKIIQWSVLGTSMVIGGALLYFAFFRKSPDEKPKRKSNPKRSRSVTKGSVRSRRRKGSKAIVKRSNPAIQSSSSLAEYRKRFEAEKKGKAKSTSKKIVRKNGKSRLKLKR
jgi:hypothetical protein